MVFFVMCVRKSLFINTVVIQKKERINGNLVLVKILCMHVFIVIHAERHIVMLVV